MGLYLAARYGIEGAFEVADRGLAVVDGTADERDGWTAAGGSPTEPSVGATALLAGRARAAA